MTEFAPDRELLPNLIDHYARVKPDQLYAEYPRSPLGYDQGYRRINYRDFANAINGVSAWLTDAIGPGKDETLAYIGPNDVRYPALVLGALKAGYCMLLLSPRNSIAANENLLLVTGCTKFIAPTPRPPPVTALLSALKLDVLEAPSTDDLLGKEYPHFEYAKSYPENKDDRLVVLHTSGSTGIPKPIVWTLETANRHVRLVELKPPVGHEAQHTWTRGKRQFMTLPPFHAAGLASMLFIGVPADMTMLVPPSGGLPTAAGLVEASKHTQIDIALVVPSIVMELSQSPGLLEHCSKILEFLMYCGGDLPQAVGDTVVSKLRLVNAYGATEIGLLSLIHCATTRDPTVDWKYLHFHPDLGVDMRQVTRHEYELVLKRSPLIEQHQVQFSIFPETQEYSTRDLFVHHPDPIKKDMWRWSARLDDVIVFLNGEKTNPISMEQHIIASSPEVTAAIVAGSQRFQASLLVEYGSKPLNPSERAAAIEKLWPSIEQANKDCPAHARIAKTHVLFTTPEKPMIRAGKGTISRAASIALYAPELDALYQDADQLAARSEYEMSGPGQVEDPQKIRDYLQKSLTVITGWTEDQIRSTDNFFTLGLDSLQAITVTRAFKRDLELPSLTPNLIYLYPSLASLTQAVLTLMRDESASKQAVMEIQLRERDDLLEEFLAQIEVPPSRSVPDKPPSHTVIVTGTTGSLGPYLLESLLSNPAVAHIYCLNRNKDSHPYQLLKQKACDLPSRIDTSCVTFWHANFTQKNLGLASETYKLLQETATVIIHNAWNVNFNLGLSSFKPDLSGVVNLINFTASAARSPHLFFLSSVSSVMGHCTESKITPESVVSTESLAPNGYANSKYIAEHLLAHAVHTRSIKASFARVGQIAGPASAGGQWNKREWFPSLVLSSQHLGVLPDDVGVSMGRIDWVPIDLLASVLVDLGLSESSELGTVEVFHPLSLNLKTWADILPVISKTLTGLSGKTPETVSLSSWVQRVRRDIETAGNDMGVKDEELKELLEKNPAAKLLEFFEGIATKDSDQENILDTQLTAERCDKLRNVGEIKEEWIKKWIEGWLQ
ncbi:NRPS-like enzyme [Penicillium capsulatum]|uniref:NRPS-like enzyme n=1 Tax=Penicillium capsulatum TaxID=69766 RepID=A0A9W9LZR9_9EURO|nr:NRPS-like enzyme [Penicillium capsulatum]KAJ6129467.1 NRPS-like enzyme [Penicillium capsulatum]